VPSAVPVPAPVAAPVAAPVQAAAPPLPSTPQEARHIFTQLLSRLGTPDGPRQREAVSHRTPGSLPFILPSFPTMQPFVHLPVDVVVVALQQQL
jgi:hypothetical protein